MTGSSANVSALWPMAAYSLGVVFLILSMVGISFFLGQRHRDRTTNEPYESGMVPTGSARQLFNVKFYLVAMLFVIFDIEAVFIFSWSVALRELGWAGYIEILVFIFVLVAALFYLWRLGALDWKEKRAGSRAGKGN